MKALDIETDAIAVDIANVDEGLESLEEPLRAAVRLVMTQADLSAFVTELLQRSTDRFAQDVLGSVVTSDDPENPTIAHPPDVLAIDAELLLLDGDRLQLEVEVPNAAETVTIALEFGLEQISGSQLAVTDLSLTLNDQAVPDSVQDSAIAILEQQLDLSRLESSGIMARYVDVTIRDRTLTIVGFVELTPDTQ